jgi:hypothetical protein
LRKYGLWRTHQICSPSPFILRHTLFFLPILVCASIIILLLTFILPKIYRALRSVFTRRQPILLTDDDEGDDGQGIPPATPIILPSGGLASDFRNHVRSLRDAGTVLFGLEIVRLLCLGALLGLSIYAAILAESPIKTRDMGFGFEDEGLDILKHHGGRHGGKKHKGHKGHHDKSTLDDYSSLEWGEFGVTALYVGSRLRFKADQI